MKVLDRQQHPLSSRVGIEDCLHAAAGLPVALVGLTLFRVIGVEHRLHAADVSVERASVLLRQVSAEAERRETDDDCQDDE